VSASPAAMAQYSSLVRRTSCRGMPIRRDKRDTVAPGTRTTRARLPTTSRMESTSSRNVGRSGPTASMTLSWRSAPCAMHRAARSSTWIARIRYCPFPPTANTGRCRSNQAMLFSKTPFPPKRTAGRRKVRKRRRNARMSDTHMHDSLYTRSLGGVKENSRVDDRALVIGMIVCEAHPVGVVESGRALKRLEQLERTVEIERSNVDWRVRRGTVGMAGDRPNVAARCDQCIRDCFP